jgi:hypothetical protein
MNKENNSSKKWYGCKSTWENIQLRDYAFRNKFKGTRNISGLSRDIACSFSGKEVTFFCTNQRPGWPSWISNHSKN